jgi:DNA-binding NtrC family response regulator
VTGPAPEPQAAATGTETILVVDDESSVRDIAARILTERGYRVLAGASPSQAQALLAAHRDEVRLLLTDVVLPECGGRELYERFRAEQPSLRVLYMSGYTGDTVLHDDALDAAMPFIQKPFTPQELALKVRQVLEA